jgi:phosphoribosylglycinamide formyltransferase-1
MKKTRAIILISGNGTNLLNILENIKSGFIDMDVFMVISNNPKAKGLNIAETHNIANLVIDTNKSFDNVLSEIVDTHDIDLLILAGFMKILPKTITDKYNGKIINIHPSLLPKHKGLETHKKVIEAKDKFHGASVHYVTSELDDGPVIIQGKYKIDQYDEEIIKKNIHAIEYEILPIAIKWFLEGNIVKLGNKFSFNGETLECPIEHILKN